MSATGDRLTLPEELLLLSWHEERGRYGSSYNVNPAVAGAAVVELALRGAVTIEDKRVLAGRERTGDPVLDSVLAEVDGARKPRTIRAWVGRWGHRTWLRDAVLSRLVERGVLRRERRRVLGLFPVWRFPVVDSTRSHELRDHVARVLTRSDPVADPRDAALGGLLHSVHGVLARLVPRELRRAARRRAKSLSNGQEMTSEVAKAVAEVNVAAVAAVGAVAGGAGGGDGGGA